MKSKLKIIASRTTKRIIFLSKLALIWFFLFFVDTKKGTIDEDEGIKDEICTTTVWNTRF
ncbi:hypothetical protein [Clostridium sp.]|uniref:hypothetical protein n=1 Tax=Clostridium sp. TaxID=1506 RepID=UPI003F4BD472